MTTTSCSRCGCLVPLMEAHLPLSDTPVSVDVLCAPCFGLPTEKVVLWWCDTCHGAGSIPLPPLIGANSPRVVGLAIEDHNEKFGMQWLPQQCCVNCEVQDA